MAIILLAFILSNCETIATATAVVKHLRKLTKLPVSVFAQGEGAPDDDQGWKFTGSDPEDVYTQAAKHWLDDGAKLVGSCCGTSPRYTRRLQELV